MILIIYEDELYRVMGANTVRHPRYGSSGGEWDGLRFILAKRPRYNRKLVGAQLLTRYGLAPDQAVTECISPYKGIDDIDDAMEWYVKVCILFIAERQKAANFKRHSKLAKKHKCRTYFEYRNKLSQLCGYQSYHYERLARWPP